MTYPKHERPIDFAERILIQNILDGIFPIGKRLPSERELATQLGVTRPTLREAIRHLEQEGWLLVQAGKPTLVRDFWREGGLNLLSRLIKHQGYVDSSFITSLLEFRLLLAPQYTADAITAHPDQVLSLLADMPAREDSAHHYAVFDWQLQRTLTLAATNPIFPLILNSFADFYEQIALIYFQPEEARTTSFEYYTALHRLTVEGQVALARELTQTVMELSVAHWKIVSAGIARVEVKS